MKKILVLLVAFVFLFSYCGKTNKTLKTTSGFNKISLKFPKLSPEQKKAVAEVMIKEQQNNKKNFKALFTKEINSAKYTPQIMFYLGCNVMYGLMDNGNLLKTYFSFDMEDINLALQRLGGFDDQINAVNNYDLGYQNNLKTFDDYKSLVHNLEAALAAKEKNYFAFYNLGTDLVNIMLDVNLRAIEDLKGYDANNIQDALDFLSSNGLQNTEAYGYYYKLKNTLSKDDYSDQDFTDIINFCTNTERKFIKIYN